MKNFKDTPHFSHRLFLIRHGETKWSLSKQHTGLTDIPLSEKGEKQARALKSVLTPLKFAKVFVSPLQRAQKTCELAGLREQAVLANELLEWDYGQYEGITTEEIRQSHPSWNLFKDGALGGETLKQVSDRADQILEKVSHIAGDVALFSSGHISRVIGARWMGLSPENAQFLSLSTASLSTLSYEHEWRVIQLWNSTSHLTS